MQDDWTVGEWLAAWESAPVRAKRSEKRARCEWSGNSVASVGTAPVETPRGCNESTARSLQAAVHAYRSHTPDGSQPGALVVTSERGATRDAESQSSP